MVVDTTKSSFNLKVPLLSCVLGLSIIKKKLIVIINWELLNIFSCLCFRKADKPILMSKCICHSNLKCKLFEKSRNTGSWTVKQLMKFNQSCSENQFPFYNLKAGNRKRSESLCLYSTGIWYCNIGLRYMRYGWVLKYSDILLLCHSFCKCCKMLWYSWYSY